MDLAAWYQAVDMERIQADVARLAAVESRMTGYDGARLAAAMIQDRFRQLGLDDLTIQEFTVPIPIDQGALLEVGDEQFRLFALYPNLVRTSSLPREGLTGPLLYVGDGEIARFNGLDVEGSLVLMDFNCGLNWLNAPLLGARAVIFLEPELTNRGEAQQKYLRVPLNIPRFLLRREDAPRLLEKLSPPEGSRPSRGFPALQRVPGRRPAPPRARLTARMEWKNCTAQNIIGFLPGTDPELRRECILLEAYYDSISVTPALSPGAEQACGIATLLELARLLKENPPRRTVALVATAGHFQALSGARALANALRREFTREREAKARRLQIRHDVRQIEQLKQRLRKAPEKIKDDRRRAAYELDLQRQIAQAEADLALTKLFYQQGEESNQAAAQEQESLYEKYDLLLLVGLDLSSQNSQLGAFHVGWYYRSDNLTRFFSPVGKRLEEYASDVVAAVPGAGDETFIDAINPTQDRNWETYIPGQLACDSEMWVEAGRAGITFATIIDSRPLIDTPLDTVERVNLANLEKQARMLACLTTRLINDPELRQTALKRIKRLPFDLKVVNGMVYEFERRKTFLPNTPVPGALVLVKGQYKSLLGVRSDVLAMADPAGDFRMQGSQDYGGAVLDAYGLDAYSGEIVYAPDLGPEGERKYPRDVRGRLGLKRPVIVFPCRSLDLYDLVDERYFETLEQIYVYDARLDSEPRSYGYALPIFAPMGQTTMGGSVSPSYVEPAAVIFCPAVVKCEACGAIYPRGTDLCVDCGAPRPRRLESVPRVKVTMGMGLLGLRLLLTNATLEAPGGIGFDPEKQTAVIRTSYQAARDVWRLDEERIRDQAKHGIQNDRLNLLHEFAKESLDQAEKQLQAKRYDRFLALARSAWAYEARAYPDVMGTARDVVKGVLFYLALLLPFAFFMERMLIAARDIRWQVAWTFFMFLIVYAVLRYVHPAFELVNTSLIILLGFVIMTLAVVVISIVTSKFNEQLEQLKQEMMGTHQADVGRLSTLGAAFSLGISNMRRRVLRTVLTCITLVLLSFTVLSFTSVQTFLRSNKIRQKHEPPYPGILVRDRVWAALEEPTAGIMANQFGHQSLIAPRAWFTSANMEKRIFIDVTRKGKFPKTYTINAMLGLAPAEKDITAIDRKVLLEGGRWFQPGDQNVCILPLPIARSLGIRPEDVAGKSDNQRPRVDIYGTEFTVIALADAQKLQGLTDLDGETITPVDYSLLKPEELKQLQEAMQSKLKLGSSSQTAPISEYKHFLATELILLPYERLINLGGTLRSVAMRFADPAKVKEATKTLMNRFELSAYAGEEGQTYLYSSVGLRSFSGLETVFVPLLIAALIVLNTMLGAVHERVREIGIFSAIGLAPVHISTLFLAESCVFANIGVILGYLLGQTVSKVLLVATEAGHLTTLAGLSLNYSSMSAVLVSLIIMATVLLSTLYPARKAAQMAVPDVERKWKLPEPEGDEMVVRLPFMLTGGDSLACNMFLREFFDAYVDYAGGDFYTDGVNLEGLDTEHGPGYLLRLRMWLAPYDLGVSQMLNLRTTPTEEGHVYEVHIVLHRLSGDINSWKKTNWLFLNLLRKQFLIWRTIPPAHKREYEAQGRTLLAACGGS